MKQSIMIIACLVAAAAACVDPEEDLGSVEAELSGSSQGSTIAASVRLVFYNPGETAANGCTGTVLTDHWILTAGHCLSGRTHVMIKSAAVNGVTTTFVNSSFEGFRHPSYSETFWGTAWPSFDLALLYIPDNGVASFPTRGKLFSDSNQPWHGGYYINGWVEGAGRGTALGSSGCPENSSDVMRRARRMPAGSSSSVAISEADIHCDGDSGGPWMFNLYDNGWIMVQFGVINGTGWNGTLVGGRWDEAYDTAAGLPPALPWIEQTMRNRLGPSVRLDITERTATGYLYRTYREQPLATLTANITGSGVLTTTPYAPGCSGPGTCRFRFVPGTWVQVTATPAAGKRFSEWTSCPAPSGNRCDVSLWSDATIGAKFVTDTSCHVDTVCRSACVDDCAGIPGCFNMCTADCTVCD
jgi:hypothetical protein